MKNNSKKYFKIPSFGNNLWKPIRHDNLKIFYGSFIHHGAEKGNMLFE